MIGVMIMIMITVMIINFMIEIILHLFLQALKMGNYFVRMYYGEVGLDTLLRSFLRRGII